MGIKTKLLIGAAGLGGFAALSGDDDLPTSDTGIGTDEATQAIESSNFNAAGRPVAATTPQAMTKLPSQQIRKLSPQEVAAVGGTEGVPFYTNLAVGGPALRMGSHSGGYVYTNPVASVTEDQTPIGRLAGIRESMNKVAEDKALAVDDIIESKTGESQGRKILEGHLASALRAVQLNIPGAAEDVPKIESEIAQIDNRIRIQANNAVNADPVYKNDMATLTDQKLLATAELAQAKTDEEKAKAISPVSNLIAKGLQVPQDYADAIALNPALRKPYLPIINAIMGNQGMAVPINTPMDTKAFKFNLYIAGQQSEGDIGLRNEQVALLERVHEKVTMAARVNSADALSTNEAYLKASTKQKSKMLESANAQLYSTMFNAVAQQDLGQNILVGSLANTSPEIQSAFKSSYNTLGEFDPRQFIASLPKDADKQKIIEELAQHAPVVDQYYDASSLPQQVGLTKFQVTNVVRGLIMALQVQDTSLGGLFGGRGDLGKRLARSIGVKEKFLND